MTKNYKKDLSGKEWLQYSISIWDDDKSSIEKTLNHPASYPLSLAKKLIRIYTQNGDTVLDPFMGAGTTLVAAMELGRSCIGFEIYDYFINIAKSRLESFCNPYTIIDKSCFELSQHVAHNSVDLCVTSPPYWNVLGNKRTADNKQVINYGNLSKDIGNIKSYTEYIDSLKHIFSLIYDCLKPNGHCIVVVMDLRKKSTFYPLHLDLTYTMKDIGFSLEDYIIWDRRMQYNNLRPLGYPYVFRVNKVHEYICIFKKDQ